MVKVRPGIAPKTSPKMEPNRSAPTTLGANEIASVERNKSISEPPSEHAGGKIDAQEPAHQQPEADGKARSEERRVGKERGRAWARRYTEKRTNRSSSLSKN